MEDVYSVYLVHNNVNGKSYVGVTKKSPEMRLFEHYKSGYALTDAIKKYGKENFSLSVIESNLNRTQAYDREKYWIHYHQSTTDKNGYNMTLGGDGIILIEQTKESRKKKSEATKENHRKKIVGMYGKKRTEESKQMMREKEYLKNRTGENNPMFGRVHSEGSKKKMTGRPKSKFKVGDRIKLVDKNSTGTICGGVRNGRRPIKWDSHLDGPPNPVHEFEIEKIT